MAIDIVHGKGYRVTNTDRTVGGPTAASDGFVLLNQATGKIFKAVGGVWTDAGIFPNAEFTQQNLDDWNATTGNPDE
jgi:hypothetical protein